MKVNELTHNVTKKYELNNGSGYEEPVDEVINYPSFEYSSALRKELRENVKVNDLFAALLQLPTESKKVTTSFKTDQAIVNRMKLFTQQTPIPIGKLYSLALHEFLEKYEQGIYDLKSK
ncbi:hypothetical protein MKY37_02210 [Psychrobacillus sp. FSL K6-2836]|uniref:hypothetical protein n=1 Tax=Psychrobacillus sp. FSL K6-2836 TaxID=2921548 RepID=UPI0030F614DD